MDGKPLGELEADYCGVSDAFGGRLMLSSDAHCGKQGADRAELQRIGKRAPDQLFVPIDCSGHSITNLEKMFIEAEKKKRQRHEEDDDETEDDQYEEPLLDLYANGSASSGRPATILYFRLLKKQVRFLSRFFCLFAILT